jgi:hypothetical protein
MRRHGVTLAYPDGFGGSWKLGACCGIAAEKDVDDVGFVMEVLDVRRPAVRSTFPPGAPRLLAGADARLR